MSKNMPNSKPETIYPFLLPGNYRFSLYIYIAVAQVRLNLGGTKGDSINNSTLDC